MSIVTIELPPFPNVPFAPGVPPVPRSPLDPPSPTPPALTGDSPDISNQTQSSQSPQWGIFDASNNPVIAPDTIVGFDFKRDYTIPVYPIEDGGFASYNKVARPFEPRFTMSMGGTEADRTGFLTVLETIVADLNLYSVATPEYTWPNANLVHWDIKRTAEKGVTLLTVDVWLQEVRVAPAPTFTNTKAVSGQSPQGGGTVQASEPTPLETANAVNWG